MSKVDFVICTMYKLQIPFFLSKLPISCPPRLNDKKDVAFSISIYIFAKHILISHPDTC